MASIVESSGEPRYCPLIRFPEEENAFILKYLRGNKPQFPDERHAPAEVSRRVILEPGRFHLPGRVLFSDALVRAVEEA